MSESTIGKPLLLELDAVTRLENDHGDHNLSIHIWLSEAETVNVSTHHLSILLDWYGPEATGQSLNDGLRDYEYVEPKAIKGANAEFQYRIKGLRGAPPRVNMDAFMKDAVKRGLSKDARVLGFWFGNEIWDGSRGSTLITKFEVAEEGRRISALGP